MSMTTAGSRPYATATASSLTAAFLSLVPRLSPTLRKGQCGRVAVVGGCEEYTGAPFFSAAASLKLGSDLSHVICDVHAGPVIKGYSPELIVHPYLRTADSLAARPVAGGGGENTEWMDALVRDRVAPLLDRFHCVVIGPGMGRDPVMLALATRVLHEIKAKRLPVIVDADGLYLVSQQPDVIRGYSLAVLTPNAVEFGRLCSALGLPDTKGPQALAQELGVSVIQKGQVDVVVSLGLEDSGATVQVVECTESGGLRRFGGQGDVLTGSLATFVTWALLAKERQPHDSFLPLTDLTAALWAACSVTRRASRLAYDKHGRGTMTGHVLEELPQAFETLGFESR